MKRLVGLAAAIALALTAASPGIAAADHTHVLHAGNGDCVVIAASGGEKYVALPDAVFEQNPNVDIAKTENRAHPLHVLVHQGVPGEHLSIQVLGSDDCTGFVNAD